MLATPTHSLCITFFSYCHFILHENLGAWKHMQCYPGVELAAALKDLQVVNFLTDNELVVNTIQRYSLRWFLGPVLAELATNHLRNATFNHRG